MIGLEKNNTYSDLQETVAKPQLDQRLNKPLSGYNRKLTVNMSRSYPIERYNAIYVL